jgi:hypothetical protein
MSFDPYDHLLKIRESIRTPTPKVGAHLGVWGFIPSTLSYSPKSTKCDSRVSLLARPFASPCLGHEPKVMVATKIDIKQCLIV